MKEEFRKQSLLNHSIVFIWKEVSKKPEKKMKKQTLLKTKFGCSKVEEKLEKLFIYVNCKLKRRIQKFLKSYRVRSKKSQVDIIFSLNKQWPSSDYEETLLKYKNKNEKS